MFGYTPYNAYSYSPIYPTPEDPYSRPLAHERARSQYDAGRRVDAAHSQPMAVPYGPFLTGDGGDYDVYPYAGSGERAYPERHKQPERQRDLESNQKRELEKAQRRAEKERQAEMDVLESHYPGHSFVRQPSPGTQPTRRKSPVPATRLAERVVPVSSPSRHARPPPRTSKVSATPPHSPEPRPKATAREAEAASKIQTFYRTRLARRKALSTISDVSAQFNKTKTTFRPPSKIDYTTENNCTSTINVCHPFDRFDIPSFSSSDPPARLPKLAYTSTNIPIHAYTESLSRLLSALDGVESGGDRVVREERKRMVRNVEREAQRMEGWILAVWESAFNPPEAQVPSSLSQLTDVASDLEPASDEDKPMDRHETTTPSACVDDHLDPESEEFVFV